MATVVSCKDDDDDDNEIGGSLDDPVATALHLGGDESGKQLLQIYYDEDAYNQFTYDSDGIVE